MRILGRKEPSFVRRIRSVLETFYRTTSNTESPVVTISRNRISLSFSFSIGLSPSEDYKLLDLIGVNR